MHRDVLVLLCRSCCEQSCCHCALPSADRAALRRRERGKFGPRLGSLSLCVFGIVAPEVGQIPGAFVPRRVGVVHVLQ